MRLQHSSSKPALPVSPLQSLNLHVASCRCHVPSSTVIALISNPAAHAAQQRVQAAGTSTALTTGRATTAGMQMRQFNTVLVQRGGACWGLLFAVPCSDRVRTAAASSAISPPHIQQFAPRTSHLLAPHLMHCIQYSICSIQWFTCSALPSKVLYSTTNSLQPLPHDQYFTSGSAQHSAADVCACLPTLSTLSQQITC